MKAKVLNILHLRNMRKFVTPVRTARRAQFLQQQLLYFILFYQSIGGNLSKEKRNIKVLKVRESFKKY